MNTSLARFAPGLLAAALSTGFVAVPVHAQTGPAAPTAATAPMPRHPPMDHAGPGMRGRRMSMELDRLKTSLKLNPSQTALWDRAQSQMMPPADGRERMKGMHDRMTAMLDDPNFDPRKLAAEMDAADTERRTRTTAMRDAWIVVYDSLNPVQRGQVREFLRLRMSRLHRMGTHMQGHMDDRGPMSAPDRQR